VRNVTYLKPGALRSYFLKKKDFIFSKFAKYIRKISPGYAYHHRYYNHYLPSILRKHLKKTGAAADIIIAVDVQVLHLAQEMFGAVHFLSLEVDNNTNRYYKLINPDLVKSVFIQSQMRYDYIFPDKKPPVFYIQNAPVFNGVRKDSSQRRDFIWSGSIDKRLAIIECLEFFKAYPQFKVMIKGGAQSKMLNHIREEYKPLIDEGRIIISPGYFTAEDFIEFISGYRIGFCFYEWSLIRESFNYLTAPSGKLFMNLSAGVPVVASNIPGFQLVKDFNAGVLIDDYEPATIFKAVQQIESNYDKYSEGAYNAAAHYSFDKNVAPYVEMLLREAKS
jgi:glycosyltransferase involved in cell wall biosynthesis